MELLSWERLYAFGYFVFWYILWVPGVIYGAMKSMQAFWGAMMYPTISWSSTRRQARRLDWLHKQRDQLERLKKSDREYYGYLLSGVLWVLVLFAGLLMVQGIMTPALFRSPPEQQLMSVNLAFLRYVAGFIAGGVALNRLTWYRSLQEYETTRANLDHRIERLEAKISLQPTPAGV
jgi:hypothetical protein